ncbi:uncharacterized protein LOC122042927 [Zingiber officinale]|uniref:DUF952 domain-containing protein n=1 Tax=Zingiber officinale TaxID=94328 RepID=A0A8J5HSD6_ZINOF|nr:uncharacterized protein LOC122042927 [Zingiber officinale]KAG6530010.1 hypothetical protein ZIOFF_012230 [Zingiber officinale]
MEKRIPNEGFVYRVSVPDEWEELQRTGATLGGDIDRTTGCIHFSDLDQVKMVLNNFFRGQENLYLLQIDATKLGEGLVYEAVKDTYFPHFYGPDRSFQPLPLDAVSKVEKLLTLNGEFSCSLLD